MLPLFHSCVSYVRAASRGVSFAIVQSHLAACVLTACRDAGARLQGVPKI